MKRFAMREEACRFMEGRKDYLCQAFVEGPIYSIEVTCNRDQVIPRCVTEVVVGSDYDCYRICAPADVPLVVRNRIWHVARRIGVALNMRGIFDVELVWCDGEPFVLEIDARMPSQTPIAVYHATGLNLFEECARCFTDALSRGEAVHIGGDESAKAVLEHVCIERLTFESLSEEERASCTAGELVERGLARYVGEGEIAHALPCRRADGLLASYKGLVTCDASRESLFATLVYVDR